MELSRLLRRGLLAIAIAIAGWLLSAVFAATASADEAPTAPNAQQNQSQSGGGLLGGLLGGVTNTLGGVTDTVVNLTGAVLTTTLDTASSVLAPPNQPAAAEPVGEPPAQPSQGSAETVRGDATQRSETAVPAPVPAVTPAPAPAPAVVTPDPTPAVRPTAPAPQPAPVATDDGGAVSEHAADGGSDPQPVKTPASPAGPATTAAPSHDNSGGARGTHGVLPAQTTLHPADAGFTTRSRAVDAAGRNTGLPASSPD